MKSILLIALAPLRLIGLITYALGIFTAVLYQTARMREVRVTIHPLTMLRWVIFGIVE